MSDNGREPQAHQQRQQQQQQSPPPQPAAHGQDSYHDGPEAPGFPPFEPIFTLLTNSSTHETVHPRVRYLFADDDPSSIIAHEAEHNAAEAAAAAPSGSHRTLVVDLAPRDSASSSADPSSWSVSWAASLSPDFAITDSQLLPMQQGDIADAPSTLAPGASNNNNNGGGLMLRVDGVEREPVDMRGGPLPPSASSSSLPQSPGSGSLGGAAGREDVEALVDDFKRRMGVLKKVVTEGERRLEAARAEQERLAIDQQHPEGAGSGSGSVPPPTSGSALGTNTGMDEEHDHLKDSG